MNIAPDNMMVHSCYVYKIERILTVVCSRNMPSLRVRSEKTSHDDTNVYRNIIIIIIIIGR